MFRYWQVSNDVPKQKGLIKGVLGYETEVKNNSDMGCLGEKNWKWGNLVSRVLFYPSCLSLRRDG